MLSTLSDVQTSDVMIFKYVKSLFLQYLSTNSSYGFAW